jgi:hypothetical protein
MVWAQASNDAAGVYRLGVSGHDDVVVPPAGSDSQALVGTISTGGSHSILNQTIKS